MTHLVHVPNESIESFLDMSKVIDLMEHVFANPDLGSMPPKIYLDMPPNDYRAMPARFDDTVGIKWAAIYPDNYANGYGASVSATIILNDIKNGRPIAMMDGMLITSYRTAAVTGLATKYLSRTNSEIASFIGCGFQTRFQIEAILNVRPITKLRLFDLDRHKSEALAEHFGNWERYNLDCIVDDNLEECARGADILTTLTPSREPFIMADWLEPGIHVNGIGADAKGKQEFEDNIARVCSDFVVDDKPQAFHSGESQHSDNKAMMIDLFYVVKNGFLRRADGITFFDSTGLAIEDIALAGLIYKNYIGEQN